MSVKGIILRMYVTPLFVSSSSLVYDYCLVFTSDMRTRKHNNSHFTVKSLKTALTKAKHKSKHKSKHKYKDQNVSFF